MTPLKKKKVLKSWESRTCNFCGKRYSTIDRLAEHIDINHPTPYAHAFEPTPQSGPDYEKLYRDLKSDQSYIRQQVLTNWMSSVATINEAISRAIGELVGGRI